MVFLSMNKSLFPYPRGYHFFHDLTTLPRAAGTPTYALQNENIMGSTFSRDHEEINGIKIGELINRKCIQLPYHCPSHKIRTHNLCHTHLFNNEDKKYYLDKSLQELRHIRRNLLRLEQEGKIADFSILKKDPELLAIVDGSMRDFSAKMQVLDSKIHSLQLKKDNLRRNFELEDARYFHHSLNQSLHNSIQDIEEQSNWNSLIFELNIKNEIRKNRGVVLRERLLLYNHARESQLVLSSQKYQGFMARIGDKLHLVRDDGNYLINIPEVFFNFCERPVFEMAEDIIVRRLYHSNEVAFYLCKKIWAKIFKRKLRISKQPRIFTKAEYERVFATALNALRKHCSGKKIAVTQVQPSPLLDTFINEILSNEEEIHFSFPIDGACDLDLGEYTVLSTFHQIYNAVATISGCARKNPCILEVIGSEFYPKYHIEAVQAVGSPYFGALEDMLRKFAENVMKASAGLACSEKLKWVFNEEKCIGYVVKLLEEETKSHSEESFEKILTKDSEAAKINNH